MKTEDIQVGSTITNGSSALRVTERVERDSRWRVPGWRGVNIALEQFGGNTGTTSFVPDYLLSSWRHVPFEWVPVLGSRDLEERYVWAPGWRWLQRELRRTFFDLSLAPVDTPEKLPFKVGEVVRFRDGDEPQASAAEGPGVVIRAEEGKVWVETLFNMWRGVDLAWFVRTSDPAPEGLQFWPPRAVQPTVDGIRGHQVTTPEEDKARRRLALEDPSITPAEAATLLGEAWRA